MNTWRHGNQFRICLIETHLHSHCKDMRTLYSEVLLLLWSATVRWIWNALWLVIYNITNSGPDFIIPSVSYSGLCRPRTVCLVSAWVLPRVLVTINVFWIGWLNFLTHIYTVRNCRQLKRCRYSTHFQFTVAHALVFPAFITRILAMDLSQFYSNFNSHVKSSCHSLTPFLSLLQLPIPKTRLDYSRTQFRTLSTTVVYSVRLLTVPSCSFSVRTPRKIPSSIIENVFTCLLPSNGRPLLGALLRGNMFTDPLPSNG
jgi:hypothetical protein